MSLIGRLTAARHRLEDGATALTTKASQILKSIAPGVTTAIDVHRMYSPPRRGVTQALDAYKDSPWLQASTKKIAERFASVEWQLFVQTGTDGKALGLHDPSSVTRTLQHSCLDERQRMTAELRQAGRLRQIHRHPLLEMLAYANPRMTGYAGRLVTQLHRDIAGEAFWALALNSMGRPSEFWPMPPPWVTALPTEKKQAYGVTVNGRTFDIPTDEVIWFREPDPAKPYDRGAGLTMSLGDDLEIESYATDFIKAFFLNRAKPELMVMVEGASEDALRESKELFERQHQGFGRAHRSWWYNSKIEVKELTQKFTDMEMTALRTMERDTILQVPGIPPEQMGIVTSSNRATAHESEKTMARSVTVPRLESAREQLQDELVPRYDPRLILGYVSPVPDDRDFQLAAIQAAPWAATVGEIRKIQGLQDRGSGDNIHLRPLNLIEVVAPTPDKIKALPGQLGLLPPTKTLDGADITVILDALRPERIVQEIEPVWNEELQAWGDGVLADLGLDVSFNMLNPLVVDQMRLVVGRHIDWIDDATKVELQGVLIEGVQAGEGYVDLSKRVKGVFHGMETYRSERIARTEVVQSASLASEQAWAQSGIVWGSEWLVTPGSERHGAAGYGGTVKQLGELEFHFDDGNTALYPGGFGEAGEDINCFLPETGVSAVAIAGSRAHYSGPIIDIETHSGHRLRVTPNHPILTPMGFLSASALVEGAHVISHGGDVGFTPGGNRHNTPPRIDQAFDLFGELWSTFRVGAHSKDFHGDAASVDGYVDVVRPMGLLGMAGNLRRGESPEEFELVLPGPVGGSVVRSRTLHQLFVRSGDPAHGIPGGRAPALDGRAVVFDRRPFQALGLGAAAHDDSGFFETSLDRAPADSAAVANRLEGFPGYVVRDQIVKIRDGEFSGHVYDFQTVSGWLIAGGIVAHNCMCATIPVMEDPDKSTDRQDANWREVNARRLVWERIAQAAYRRGFKAQEKDVLEALRKATV